MKTDMRTNYKVNEPVQMLEQQQKTENHDKQNDEQKTEHECEAEPEFKCEREEAEQEQGEKVEQRQELKEDSSSVTMNGSRMLVESLKKENVDLVFGYPGGAVLTVYDALYDGGIPHILTRHEQGAIHAAEGYARVTGKPGVVIATSGPGATNIVTGLTDAMMDSLPLVVFTGQVNSSVLGTDAFQEAPTFGITMPITKHSYQVKSVEELPRIIKEAFHIASTGRPGPVLIDIPKDISNDKGDFHYPNKVHLQGYHPKTEPDEANILSLVTAMKTAKRPVILAGAGVLHAQASERLRLFAEKAFIPVVNTLLGLGSFPHQHPLFLGMGGMHGTYAANMALYEADLLINIGARFDDRLTGALEHFAQKASVAHIDIDPSEIGKLIPTQYPIVGDAKEVLTLLVAQLEQPVQSVEWVEEVTRWKQQYPLWYRETNDSLLPQKLIEIISSVTNGDAIITTDVGQHQMWTAQYYAFTRPNQWITSGGLGTMGFGFPAAIGAQLAQPNKPVVAIIGDAGFQMTLQELAVLKEYNLPVIVVIVNNFSMGMVRQWQQLFYEERYSHSLLPLQPDYVQLASAFGLKGVEVRTELEVEKVLTEALSNKEPIVIDCHVASNENVYPMIAPGKGIHEMVGVKP